jgi:hypothetical protein
MKNKEFKDLLTSIDRARKIHARKMKRAKLTSQTKLIVWLMHRIKLLEGARQHYQQNPNLMKTLKIANITLVQNDIEALKELLDAIN